MAKEVNKRVNVWVNGREVENNVKSIRAAMLKLTNQLNKMEIGSAEYIATSRKLRDLKAIYDEHCRSLKMTEEELSKNSDAMKDLMVVAGGAVTAVHGLASAYQKAVSSIQEYIDAYARIDDAMVGVSKYTGLTKDEVKSLNEELQKMDTRTSIEKLNALAADAGRLGITSKEVIKDFVEAADIINVALGEDLGEDAVKEIGKLAEMFGATETMGLRGAMLATGSAINTLAQSSSASERYLMDFTSRLAGAANQAQISQANILGFASVLDRNKQQVEMSATALQKLLMNMFTAPEKYAHLAGMSVKEFADALKNDANEALISFLDTLNKKGGLSELAPIFNDLGLDGARASGVISVLAGKIDDVKEAQATANAAFAEGNSVINEAAAANSSAAAQMEKMNKQIEVQKARLGEDIYPIYQKIISGTLSFTSGTVSLVRHLKTHAEILSLIGVLFSKRIVQFTVLIAKQIAHTAAKAKDIVVTKAQTVATNLSTIKLAAECIAHDLAAKKIKLHVAAQEMLMVVMKKTPWGLVLATVTAIAAAMISWTKHTREAKKELSTMNKEIGDRSNGSITLFEKLRQQYSQLGNSMKDKEKFIKDNKSAFEELGVSVQSVVDAENLFIANKDNFVNSLLARAKAAAYQSKAQEIMNKNIERTEPLQQKIDEYNKKIEELRNKMPEITPDTDPSTLDSGLYQELNSYYSMIGTLQRQIDIINQEAVGYIKRQIEVENEADRLFSEGGFSAFSYDNSSSNSTTSNTPDQKTLTARENFHKKLQQMAAKAQADTLIGWEKTKQEIINKYDELLAEAKTLYGEDSEEFKKVQQLKLDAIAAAGQQYLEKNGKILEDFSQKFRDWQNEAMPKGEDGLADKLLGTEQKWRERTVYAQNALNTLIALRGELADEPDVDLSLIDAEIERTETELLVNLPQMALADLQNTLRRQHSDIGKFIAQEQESITDSTLTETERQKKAIRERYDVEIRALEELQKEYLKKNMMDKAVEAAEDINRLMSLMNTALANVDKAASSGQKSVWQQLAEFDWSNMSGNWQQGLNLMTQGLQEFGGAAMDIFGSINQIMANMTEAELQRNQETYDAKTAALQKQLSQGVISQKKYDAQMEKLSQDKEKKEKKLKHEQFAREKAANIVQALINGAMAITNIWAMNGGIPILAAALTAVAAAVNIAQVAAIASQPNPYAKGGYIRGRQYAVMGEQGDEWVASNRLLRDRETADIIAALDEYQRGDRLALRGISFAAPDPKIMSQAVSENGRTFAPSNQTTTNNYYQNDNGELLKELRQLNEYLRDPNNRRAYISREIQLEFDEQEREVRELARL